MNDCSNELLGEVGRQLDRLVFPRVKNGGFVQPSEPHVFFQPMGKEKHNAAKRQRRSATEPWSGPSRRQGASSGSGSTGGSRATSDTASFLGAIGRSPYQAEISSVCEAYPGARIWAQGEDFWLLVESSLLPNLPKKACFLIAVSAVHQSVRAWAFWDINAIGMTWIGPRHTNFPDGSICAFEPIDGTWQFGDSLIALLDIYTVWALRHLHLEVYGRWPGPQSVAPLYERLQEVRDDELCGCGRSQNAYADCCKPIDIQMKRLPAAVSFCFFTGWSLRSPPESVVRFALYRKQPPIISDLLDGIGYQSN